MTEQDNSWSKLENFKYGNESYDFSFKECKFVGAKISSSTHGTDAGHGDGSVILRSSSSMFIELKDSLGKTITVPSENDERNLTIPVESEVVVIYVSKGGQKNGPFLPIFIIPRDGGKKYDLCKDAVDRMRWGFGFEKGFIAMIFKKSLKYIVLFVGFIMSWFGSIWTPLGIGIIITILFVKPKIFEKKENTVLADHLAKVAAHFQKR